MHLSKTARGFERIDHSAYPPTGDSAQPGRLVQQSSAVGADPDAFDRPGSSFLWVGEHHHLNRAEVRRLIEHLTAWVETGSLEVKG